MCSTDSFMSLSNSRYSQSKQHEYEEDASRVVTNTGTWKCCFVWLRAFWGEIEDPTISAPWAGHLGSTDLRSSVLVVPLGVAGGQVLLKHDSSG